MDKMNTKQKSALMLFFVLFLLLFNVPFIALPHGMLGPLPGLMIYLALVWLVLIVVMGVFYSRLK